MAEALAPRWEHYLDDDWLMRRTAGGDPRAFEEIVRRYEARLTRFAASLLAGDLDLAVDAVQDVFLRLWRGAATYQECGKLSAYLYRMTHNACVDIGRRTRPSVDIDQAAGIPAPVDTASTAVDSAFADAVRTAVGELPDEQRLVFVLSVDGLSYAEIAEIAACPVGTVASRKRLAVAALRTMLADWKE